jgi:ribose 5-phosphate isomerase A
MKFIYEVILITTISQLAFSKIKPGMTVSLGGGHNVFNLAKTISEHNLTLNLVSPSEITRIKASELGLQIHPSEEVNHIDMAFDGCDSVDYNFNTLKSGGGIHLYEKIAAQMSSEYILLLPAERITKELSSKVPLCIEVAPPTVRQVIKAGEDMGLKMEIRQGDKVASLARSPQGNLLVDAVTNTWNDIDKLVLKINNQNGVVATSYFKNLVTSLITTDKQNNAIEIKKGELK